MRPNVGDRLTDPSGEVWNVYAIETNRGVGEWHDADGNPTGRVEAYEIRRVHLRTETEACVYSDQALENLGFRPTEPESHIP